MKKLLIPIALLIFLLVGCENIMNTPTNKVENFLGKYQKMDSKVLDNLDEVVKKDKIMNMREKKEYKELLKRQYQNLSYKIKEENINKDIATVDVEIEVLDYKSSINKAKEKYLKLKSDNKNENTKEYIDYKIKLMKETKEKIKYTLTINLIRENGIWVIDDLKKDDYQKIHGLF